MPRRIQTLLLNAIYLLALVALSPWMLVRRIRQGKHRRGWSQKLWGQVPCRTGDRACVWIHAVSVGEVLALTRLVPWLERTYPGLDIAISTTTETGYDLAAERFGQHHPVFFCPFDFSWAVQRTIARLRPNLLVLTELELWPNLIGGAKQCGLPVALINGRIGESSFRGYHRFRWLFGDLWQQLDLALVQTDDDRQRLQQLGVPPERIQVTGNVKFDQVQTDRQTPTIVRLSRAIGVSDRDRIWVAGSTQEDEDQMAVAIWQRLRQQYPRLRLILVPRHPDRVDRLVRWIESRGLKAIRRSQLANRFLGGERREGPLPDDREANVGPPSIFEQADLLVVDVMGELADWWGLADLAYVGGSMGKRGGQNMIEPAGYGIPISFGPNTWNFRLTVQSLLERDAATQVSNFDQLTSFVRGVLERPEDATRMGHRAQCWVLTQQGAVRATGEALARLLPSRRVENIGRVRAA